MKSPKRFCVNGHDTALCGRDKTRTCNQCQRQRSQRRYQRRLANKSDDGLDAKALANWPAEWGTR